MEPLLIYPESAPFHVVKTLEEGGYPFIPVGLISRITQLEPEEGWSGAIICADQNLDDAFFICRHLRTKERQISPLLLIVDRTNLDKLELREDLFDDFVTLPLDPREFQVRLQRLFFRTGRGLTQELIEYGPLKVNLETYQASVSGKLLDLTYMEYQLLTFLASHPGRVFDRETLLSRVWGYEYYGGARTVDVHIRRLRAKLGEQHESMIETVRSVGYRFGRHQK
ncbi:MULTISPECIES: response regulator transcription factor [Acidithrix]|uniref:Transcriptional regulatory protein SrrA n=1 Tax=Acidithrix ferrooxidans TaxID=1280514 RepID=A0A0D8HM51_9ACTN|nr:MULTISPECIES: response regulator transcription factor [Acidithrix]KJF18919.1 transcriptional regulatory protein SrrA [Acidithrix ferrooxidans]CAG4917310.1 unnamed protein product [Acidithrix sp. C25]